MGSAESQSDHHVVVGRDVLVDGGARLIDDRRLDPVADPVRSQVSRWALGELLIHLPPLPILVSIEAAAALPSEPFCCDEPFLDR